MRWITNDSDLTRFYLPSNPYYKDKVIGHPYANPKFQFTVEDLENMGLFGIYSNKSEPSEIDYSSITKDIIGS